MIPTAAKSADASRTTHRNGAIGNNWAIKTPTGKLEAVMVAASQIKATRGAELVRSASVVALIECLSPITFLPQCYKIIGIKIPCIER
ncbi:hypothetical protein ANFP_09380 [Acidithiobacillus ferrooxidans]|nr:hypothetical protein ANFP_09380 [Acidithiobacillus ferrooxidans]